MTKPQLRHNPEPLQKMDARGREVLDTAPSVVSVRKQKMVSLSDQMRQTVLQMRHEAVQAENDSLDDEKDFDIPDDEPRSPHELFVESPEYEMFLDDISEFARKKNSAPPAEPLAGAEAPKSPPEPTEPDAPVKGKK